MANERQAELLVGSNVSYSSQILPTMNDFRKERTLCDVIVNVKGVRKFAAHCIVLEGTLRSFVAGSGPLDMIPGN